MNNPPQQKPTMPRPKQKDLAGELSKKLSDIQLDKIKEEAMALAQNSGLPFINLIGYPIDMDAMGLLKENEARSGQIVVMSKDGKTLKVAVVNPENGLTKDMLRKLEGNGLECSVFIASSTDMSKTLERYKELRTLDKVQMGVIGITEAEITELQKSIKNIGDLKERLSSSPIGQILNVILAGALKIEASDVHFENEEKILRLRYRVDGILTDVADFDLAGYDKLLNRTKLMSGLKINIHNKPQDGRFTLRHNDFDIEVRVSIIPSEYGENIVMRILNPLTIKQKLEDLGMRDSALETIKRLLEKTTGSIITTGPTGSGKTTTLYAFIKHINSPEVKIITIEDPIEYHIEGITQTQVNEGAGYTFANGLRSIVRQDPDVVLVGEIRDGETAEIAMQAALTGHQVFSTLHANNAPGAIPRLIDLGVKPITIAPAVHAAIAQRLVRKLCSKCKIKKKITAKDIAKMKEVLNSEIIKKEGLKEPDENTEIYYPSQCSECNQTGYKGRIGLFEIFEIDKEVERLIQTSPAMSDVEDLAEKKGMISLLQDGFIKVLDGMTSVEEVRKVAG